MKFSEIEAGGQITPSGSLKMYMGELNAFFKKWPGARVVSRFFVALPGTTESQRGYYFGYIVPAIKKGLLEIGEVMMEEDVDYFLRSNCPFTVVEYPNIITGKYAREVKEIRDLSRLDMVNFIEWVKVYAAENFSLYIEDPELI